MYYLLDCPDPPRGERALLSHQTDSPRRRWRIGSRFKIPPPLPVVATIEDGQGALIEFWDVPVPLMSDRLANALQACGIANLDLYDAEIRDPKRDRVVRNYKAFNLIGKIAMADLDKSVFDAPDGDMIAVSFDLLELNETLAQGAAMFRLAESVSGIVVHHSIKIAVEAAGIDTLDFMHPKEWVS